MQKGPMQNHVSAAITENIGAHIERERILAEQNNHAAIGIIKNQQENKKLKEDADSWEQTAIRAKREAEFYKELLSQPLHIIAAANEDFKKTYDLQQELLATWMVSQRAFKELAIDLGLELGKNKKDIIEEGLANREKVLDNTTLHDNNLGDHPVISPHKENIKNKIRNNK